MIQIPESIEVSRNKKSEAMLLEKGRAWLEKDERAPGLHASHLLDPLQAYWQIKVPQPLGDREVVMFLAGKVLHAFVLGYVDGVDVDIDASDGGSSYSGSLGVTYSPDKVLDGVVRELKTSRSFYEPKSIDDLGVYIEQLLIYMSATQTLESELWVLYLNLKDDNGKTKPQFRCYHLRISESDLKTTTDRLREGTGALKRALDGNDPSALPLCREWKCGFGNCPYYGIQCKPEGRYGTPEFDEGKRKKKK